VTFYSKSSKVSKTAKGKVSKTSFKVVIFLGKHNIEYDFSYSVHYKQITDRKCIEKQNSIIIPALSNGLKSFSFEVLFPILPEPFTFFITPL